MVEDVFSWIDHALAARREENLFRHLRTRQTTPAQDFSSNDYLGLRCDSRLHEAGHQAAIKAGSGSGSSPAVSGWTQFHDALCVQLAQWKGTESALIFASGYVANLSTVAALVQSGDVVYADRLAHACLIDGAKLSGAKLRVFPHNDAAKLAEIMDRDCGRFRRSLILTESLFSMDGDVAPLLDIGTVATDHQAMLLVDEAHAAGLFGPAGQGLVESLGLGMHPNLIRMGTLSKAIGVQGGFVAGSKNLIDWLRQSARGWIYSTSISPYLAAAAAESIRIIQNEPDRRLRVLEHADFLRCQLTESGWSVPPGQGPIVPVILGDAERTMNISKTLESQGFLVGAIRPPTVPRGTSRLRLSVTAQHTSADISRLVDALNRAV